MIRQATAADRATITALQTASWASAYRGLLPDAYLDGQMANDLADSWLAKFTQAPAPDFIFLAAPDGEAAGFIAVVPRDGWAYVDNLHVHPDRWGGGIGRALMATAAASLHRAGFTRAYLTVLADNAAAIAFYDRMGGVAAARLTEQLYGNPVQTIRYEWTDLPALAAR